MKRLSNAIESTYVPFERQSDQKSHEKTDCDDGFLHHTF